MKALSALAASRVPEARVRVAREAAVTGGDWVLYWMIAARRPGWNFGLERAAEWARALGRPLLVLEPLRVAYPHASARLHRFVLDGMRANQAAFAESGVRYRAYVEPEPGAGRGLLEALAARAALVVTDAYPAFFLPRMVAAAARRLEVRLEVVDSNGLVPLAATPGTFPTAFAFRRWLQRALPGHLEAAPLAEPLAEPLPRFGSALPREVETRWPEPEPALLAGEPEALARLPIDQAVAPVPTRGGCGAAREELAFFVRHRLARYAEDRNHPDREATSGLSPYLHFGHVAAHEVFAAVLHAEEAASPRSPARPDGRRGWYGVGAAAEGFLDQLVTWRELGFVFAWHRPDHDRYESLPDWARATLESAPRGKEVYDLETLAEARTGDELWNAVQTELLRTGKLHNYLRMLWGKKILEWSPSPREALARTFHLNDRYALDGRDPNSVSGITWCFGRFDRPWGPRRPVFGTVRYMSSDSTRKKLELDDYLARFGAAREERDLFGARKPARRRGGQLGSGRRGRG